MTLSSMTGFARESGTHQSLHWQWEAKSVNGKGLDVRCRLPAGYEGLEIAVREAAAKHLKRGNIQVLLTCNDPSASERIVINEPALKQVLAIAENLRARLGGEPLRAEAILGLRGIIDQAAPELDEAALAVRDGALQRGLETLFKSLAAMRQAEGRKLQIIVETHLARIEELSITARDNPARSPEFVRQRLAEQVARLVDASASFDRDRLHQEAILLATRADIQEELDRLFAHVDAVRALIAANEPAGRKLDFLTQEFNREANTLCSKAADRGMTATGLDLKTAVDQLREQVANIE
jgi:uncharacterized protein (TIGR00255 family)